MTSIRKATLTIGQVLGLLMGDGVTTSVSPVLRWDVLLVG